MLGRFLLMYKLLKYIEIVLEYMKFSCYLKDPHMLYLNSFRMSR